MDLEIDWMSFPGFHPGRYVKNGPSFVDVDAKHESEHTVNSSWVFFYNLLCSSCVRVGKGGYYCYLEL